MKQRKLRSESVEDTHRFAMELVMEYPDVSIIALHGELGSGKTCFVQGLAMALDIIQPVTSPTFTVINEYKGKRRLYHMDLYRLHGPDEVLALGFEEYMDSGGIVAIEWPDRAESLLPPETIHVHMTPSSKPEIREIVIERQAFKV